MSHVLIIRFNSNEDRDFYVKEDPAHQAFKDAAAAVVKKAQVVDFQEGISTNAEYVFETRLALHTKQV
jgi:hypothetical protein